MLSANAGCAVRAINAVDLAITMAPNIPPNNNGSIPQEVKPDAKLTTAVKLCDLAIGYDGRWEPHKNFSAYVNEAKLRGRSEVDCMRLSGRFTEQKITSIESSQQRQ